MQAFVKKMEPQRRLYLQVAFTALAFLMMVVLSYLFMSNMVHMYLVRNAKSVLTQSQIKIESILQEPEATLDGFSQTVRHMLLRGDDMETLHEYIVEITEHMVKNKRRISGFDGFYGYFETLTDEAAYLHGRLQKNWIPPEDFVPQDRPWYQAALAADGKVATTAPYVDFTTGKLVFTYARVLYTDDGRLLGVTCLNVAVDPLGDDVVAMALAQGGYGMLLSQDLTVLAHPHKSFVGRNLRDPKIPISIFADDLLKGAEVFERPVVSFNEETSLAFFRKLQNGWHLGLVTPKRPFYASVTNMAISLSLLGLVLASALIYVLVRIDAARNKADAESKQKSVFLANMSHEMRTPLNAVIGLSELILEDEALSEENSGQLEKIYNAGLTLLSTVNDILDISKIEAGKFELALAEYDIPSMINDAITQSILHIGEKPLRFTLNIDETLPTALYGDELRIRQIFNNLLSNAFKFTREGRVELHVSCARGDGDDVWMTARVQDTGIGIRPEDMENLFVDYAQVDMASNRRIPGTGLGLPITKRMAELMDGSISVASKYGEGTVFTVRFRQKFVSDAVIGPETVKNLKDFHYSEKKRLKHSKLARLHLPYARVLIVDDMMTNLDVAKGLMKPYNMRIDCVLSGQEAIDAIRDETVRYNAVFMDHMMPEMDGIEAAQRIRDIGTEYAKNIPIIALTANALVGNEEMFLGKGFQAFIPKPIEMTRLDAAVRHWVRDKKFEEALLQESGGVVWPEGMTILQGLPRKVDGVDLRKGLERFNNDEDAFLQVLRSYAVNTRPLLEVVRRANKEQLADYAVIVHGIKGASQGICADAAGSRAEALEKAAKEGNFDFVAANNAALIECVEGILDGLDVLLQQIAAHNPKPRRERPDKEALGRLLAACDAYDMHGVDTAMADIESCEYEFDNGLVAWLRKNVDQTNFMQIKEKLSALEVEEGHGRRHS